MSDRIGVGRSTGTESCDENTRDHQDGNDGKNDDE